MKIFNYHLYAHTIKENEIDSGLAYVGNKYQKRFFIFFLWWTTEIIYAVNDWFVDGKINKNYKDLKINSWIFPKIKG